LYQNLIREGWGRVKYQRDYEREEKRRRGWDKIISLFISYEENIIILRKD